MANEVSIKKLFCLRPQKQTGGIVKGADEKEIKFSDTKAQPIRLSKKRLCVKGLARNLFLLFQLAYVS